jgi:iron(III) transport system permease protein
MLRRILGIAVAVGWVVLLGAVVAPLLGGVWAVFGSDRVSTLVVGSPDVRRLALQSVALSVVATLTALTLGILPSAVLGSCSRRAWSWLVGLILAPLIVPPQVYAYAWGLLGSGGTQRWAGGAVRAGVISGAWLWPIVALVIAAGWRSTGRAVYRMALLDAAPLSAFMRVVLPSLRPTLVAASCLVAGITLIEYAIPHLTLCRVWSTELMVLVEVGAPAGQIVRMAVQPFICAVLLMVVAWRLVRGSGSWEAIQDDTTFDAAERLNRRLFGSCGPLASGGAALIWLATLGLPVGLMLANLRVPGAWMQGLAMFSRQWADSLQVSVAAGLASVVLAVATAGWWRASGRQIPRWGGLAALLVAAVPPPAMGVGLVMVFNRGGLIGEVYAQTPLVWTLALVGRYGAVAVLILWMTLGRRDIATVDQARVDGGTGLDILGHVLLPLIWPSLMAAGLIVAVLAMFEVVVTQMTVPPAYGSIAMTILNYMHYGRDDAVIASSVTVMVAGVLLTQVCAHFLSRVGK